MSMVSFSFIVEARRLILQRSVRFSRVLVGDAENDAAPSDDEREGGGKGEQSDKTGFRGD